MSLPIFPTFERLNIEHKEPIEKITCKYEPYSDFNFVSMFCYDIENQLEISILNDNLVIRMRDYLTREPFYSFLGNNKPIETIKQLIDLSKKEQIPPQLQLIPEVNISNHFDEICDQFILQEDPDNHDYIIPTENFINSSKKIRWRKNRFIKQYPEHEFIELDISDISAQGHILDLFHRWEQQKQDDGHEIELGVIKRLFQSAKELKLNGVGVFCDNKLVGFAVSELLHSNYCLGHFKKHDLSFDGVNQYLVFRLACHIQKLGYSFINIEQDLGIEGLKKYKQSWYPSCYLKKYIIKEKI